MAHSSRSRWSGCSVLNPSSFLLPHAESRIRCGNCMHAMGSTGETVVSGPLHEPSTICLRAKMGWLLGGFQFSHVLPGCYYSGQSMHTSTPGRIGLLLRLRTTTVTSPIQSHSKKDRLHAWSFGENEPRGSLKRGTHGRRSKDSLAVSSSAKSPETPAMI